jgi:hypothetical protein
MPDLSSAPQDIQDGLADLAQKFATHQSDRAATQQASATLGTVQADASAKVATAQSALATCQAAEQQSGIAVTTAIGDLEHAISTEFADNPLPAAPTNPPATT